MLIKDLTKERSLCYDKLKEEEKENLCSFSMEKEKRYDVLVTTKHRIYPIYLKGSVININPHNSKATANK